MGGNRMRRRELARFDVACPACGTQGWTWWDRLPRGMRCHRCGVGFWIAVDGSLQTEGQVPKSRVACPRCAKVTQVSAVLLHAAIACRACRLRFIPQPGRPSRTKSGMPPPALPCLQPGQNRQRLVAGLCVVVGALAVLLATVGLRWQGACRSLEETVCEFTNACLSRRTGELPRWVCPGQQANFHSWFELCCATLVPKGPGKARLPQVSVISMNETEDHVQVRAVISSAATGKVSQTQYWVRKDQNWLFDARETLLERGGAADGTGGKDR